MIGEVMEFGKSDVFTTISIVDLPTSIVGLPISIVGLPISIVSSDSEVCLGLQDVDSVSIANVQHHFLDRINNLLLNQLYLLRIIHLFSISHIYLIIYLFFTHNFGDHKESSNLLAS